MRHLATIREIASLRPIAGADRIEVAQVDGWECVVQKGEFHTGEHIVYIEVDSIVPERPEFEFLRDRKFRVRTIKLRGQVSQGLVLPLSILPNGTPAILGADVTDALGIKKYDPEAQQEAQLLTKQPQKPQSAIARFLMRFKWYRKLFMKPKRKYEFGVCSRNIYLGTPDNSSYWTIARQLHIEDVLKHLIGDYETIVLQGEICGNQIQGNKYHISGYDLFAFNLIYPDHKCGTAEIKKLLEPYGIKTVPIVEEGKTLPETIAELVEYSKGKSVVRKEQKREGVVMRNVQSNISFKVINPDFLLAEKD